MAVLTQNTSGGNFGFHIEEHMRATAGTYIATCIGIKDEFGVDRPSFDNPAVMKKTDVTRFLFGAKTKTGNLVAIQTYEFSISGNSKSNLMKFLAMWLGSPPALGWDYCEMLGKGAVLQVSDKTSTSGKVYQAITGIRPVKDDLNDYSARVVPLEEFRKAGLVPDTVSTPQAPVSTGEIDGDGDVPF